MFYLLKHMCYATCCIHFIFFYHINNFWKNNMIKIFVRNIIFNFSFLKVLLSIRKLGCHKQKRDRHCEHVAKAL